MARRKGIRPVDRFEVFKRDAFTCQYCGRTPPHVVLQVDHIVAVVAGGENRRENYATACAECNIGKGARPLEQASPALAVQMEERKERADQMRAYNAFLLELRNEEDERIERLGFYWFDHYRAVKGETVFGPAREPSIRRFISLLPEAEILDAIDIAFGRLPVDNDNDWKTWKYFCGICWRRIRRARGEDV